jgi:biopolymer transport protein ExbD
VRKKRRSNDEAEINMTPMLDIIFIMLIFFIVTTSFTREFGLDANRISSSSQVSERLSETIFVKIENDGQIFIRNRATDIRLVQANIESDLALAPDAAVVISAARNSDAGLLVRVIDKARVAGAVRVSMLAVKE